MTMKSQFSYMTSSSNFFDVVLFLLSSVVPGPSFMSISSLVQELWQFLFIRDWRKIRNWKYPRPSFVQYLETGTSKDTKFGMNVSNKMLLNAEKCQGSSFYRFWVIKGKLTGGVKFSPPLPPPRFGLTFRI